jgi:hypothetical protein
VSDEIKVGEGEGEGRKISSAQWTLAAIIAAFVAGGYAYHWLIFHGIGHSAALFTGIPAIMAILLALAPKAKTVTGGILKGMTLALLTIAPLLGEGYLCILMASPLFFIVGIIVGAIVDVVRARRAATLSCIAIVLLPLSLEGVSTKLSFRRSQTVEVSRIVNASADAVEDRLARGTDLSKPLPAPLRIGFPRPLRATGEGLESGALRTIHFAGAEGDPPGDLVMRVTVHQAGIVRFETVSDNSKLTQWIAWKRSDVEWKQVDATHTLITWRVQFDRQLDPAWYFAPLERAAMREAAAYLIDACATPSSATPDESR